MDIESGVDTSTDRIPRTEELKSAMTVDVEDYFQVSAFEPHIDRESWSNRECRVERNTNVILELFADTGTSATFFFLGWVAERFPALLRKVAENGHEIASHGFSHQRVNTQSRDRFRQDVERTKKVLEDVGGRQVLGYRAASFSIGSQTPWAYEVLAETGHEYSSSIFPIRHDRYGMRHAQRLPHRVPDSGLVELPVTTIEHGGLRLPCGGGGYFRLLPYAFTAWGIRGVNKREGLPAMFYFHPWELDPDQPRVPGTSIGSHFRHYVNLKGYEKKLSRLLREFRWTSIDDAFSDHIRSAPG